MLFQIVDGGLDALLVFGELGLAGKIALLLAPALKWVGGCLRSGSRAQAVDDEREERLGGVVGAEVQFAD